MAERIQRKRTVGWRMPEGAVYVGRPTRWGNIFWRGQRVISPGAYGAEASPYQGLLRLGGYGNGPRAFEIRKVRDRADAVHLFRDYLRHDPSGWPPEEIRACLGGADLACWCPLPQPGMPDICHAAVLLEIASGGRL